MDEVTIVRVFRKKYEASFKKLWFNCAILDDMFWDGRCLAYQKDQHSLTTDIAPEMNDLIRVMDYLGEIRHDFNAYSFFPGRLYSMVYNIDGLEIPRCFHDFALHDDSHAANENYDRFKNPSDSLISQLTSIIQEELSSLESTVIWTRFAQNYSQEETARMFKLTPEEVLRVELVAVLKLRECGRLPDPKDICLYKVISEDLPVNSLID